MLNKLISLLIKVALALLAIFLIVFFLFAFISISEKDKADPGGYCKNGYRYERWTLTETLVRDTTGNAVPCEVKK